jgi:hypothetical protein
MSLKLNKYYARLERVKTDSWLDIVVILFPSNMPECEHNTRPRLEFIISMSFPDWELLTYALEDSTTPPTKYML